MINPILHLRTLVAVHIAVGLLLAVAIVGLSGLQLAASFATGVLLVTVSAVGLAWAWWRLVLEKTIAWTVMIIVIKYAVLLGSIFYLSKRPEFSPLAAGFGVASFVISALILAGVMQKEKI